MAPARDAKHGAGATDGAGPVAGTAGGSALGVSRQTINSIEQERYTPSLPLALALARLFETTVEAMFGASD